ncbi:MAG TPA: hypothetical protein VK920_10720 [Solirubrobacterales bacterium]|nr:hypothetical protein [Solirubrobacterales bacterium]
MPERINASQVLVVAGAVVLFASLFLDWYEPRFAGESGLSAWSAFELGDILLAGLCLVAIAAVVPVPRQGGAATLAAARWQPWLGLAALAFVAISLVNDPPAVRDRGLEAGAWIGLAGAALLAIGGLLSFARVSLVVTLRPAESEAPTATTTKQPRANDA